MYQVIAPKDIKDCETSTSVVWNTDGKTVPVIEGYMPYLGFKTYFRIAGKGNEAKAPLLVLHGGPGGSHNTLEVLDVLSLIEDRQIIYYDQLGCGKSYVEGHTELWNIKTWIDELEALRQFLGLDKIHLLGQSFGGFLELAYCIEKKSRGVLSMVVSSGLSNPKLWAEEQRKWISKMDKDSQNAIAEAEASKNFNLESYIEADKKFMLLHSCDDFSNVVDAPECFKRGKAKGRENVYKTTWGKDEYNIDGTVSCIDLSDKLQEIDTNVLIVNGSQDLCSETIAKDMHKRIPNSKWVMFDGVRHRCYYEAYDEYIPLVDDWMSTHE